MNTPMSLNKMDRENLAEQATDSVVIHQIFYDSRTRLSLDPGFLPLDNTKNLKPDWREYWPIRNYILEHKLDEFTYYGFLSPKFFEKTGLSSDEVYRYLKTLPSGLDVVSFSPFFDVGAFFRNTLDHCLIQHPNAQRAIVWALENLCGGIDLSELVMHSRISIFCNYFIAKASFWREWLSKCELVWSAAEGGGAEISSALNVNANGHTLNPPVKTFIVERVASLILATQKSWNSTAYPPLKLPFSSAKISSERDSLLSLDALKIAYCVTGCLDYLHEHERFSRAVLTKCLKS